MHTEHCCLTWTLPLLLLTGVLCNLLKVELLEKNFCAVEGSPVVVHCSFSHANNLSVIEVIWAHFRARQHLGVISSDSTRGKKDPRIQFIGDRYRNCSFKIHPVEHADAGTYGVRFIPKNKLRFLDFITLKILDLNISVSRPNGTKTIKEGDSVTLTCTNSCDSAPFTSAFTWFENGEPTNQGPVLNLSNMTSTNSGNYTCSLRTNWTTAAAFVIIDVEYGPKNTSAIEEESGSNINLICRSQANPSVENYTWYEVAEGGDVTVVGHLPDFLPDVGGRFLCGATNKHGSQNSSVVTLSTKANHWVTFTRDLLIISALAVLVIVTTATAVWRLNRKRKRAPETNRRADVQSPDYVNRLVNELQSEELVVTEVIYTTVDIRSRRKPNIEQQVDSLSGEEVIYSVVCSSSSGLTYTT